jgi:hypothetical protein
MGNWCICWFSTHMCALYLVAVNSKYFKSRLLFYSYPVGNVTIQAKIRLYSTTACHLAFIRSS